MPPGLRRPWQPGGAFRTRQDTPEQTRTYQNRPEQTRTDQNRPEQTRTDQKTPEDTRRHHNTPEQTRTDQNTPEHTTTNQNRPEHTRTDQNTPEHTRTHQNAPDYTGECFLSTERQGPRNFIFFIEESGESHENPKPATRSVHTSSRAFRRHRSTCAHHARTLRGWEFRKKTKP